MRFRHAAALALLLATLPAVAQNGESLRYAIELDANRRVHTAMREHDGKNQLFVTLQFKIRRLTDGELADDVAKEEIVVEEDGRRVAELEIHEPRSADPLTTVLAMDVSGSMAERDKIVEARRAALLFLDKLHPRADSGLILFDDRMQTVEPPARDPDRQAEHRRRLRAQIETAQPLGGTAYLDATANAVDMLRDGRGRKAVLVMTDGVDLNSTANLDEVIRKAQAAEVPVYTLGVGEPGRNEPVTSILVLDRSGSMLQIADRSDRVTKMAALQRAASRFVELMRHGARTTLLPFSNSVDRPDPFTEDRDLLKGRLSRLRASGGTAFFDATYDGLMTLQADTDDSIKLGRSKGRRAVVAMTDGIDNRSRRRVEQVIRLANESETPVYVLGLGQTGELDERTMRKLAQETGGEYYHARNQEMLTRIFENLSIKLHDDGIDETSLRRLAEETGGTYYLARDVSRLSLIYSDLADELQSTYSVTFPSRRSSHDGTARGIDISVIRDGKRVSDVASVDYQVHGVILAEMEPRIYLTLLLLLGGLLALPVGVRRLYQIYGGQ